MSTLHESCALCLELPEPLPYPVIAVGSETKNTICAGSERTLLVSRPLADLASPESYREFRKTIEEFQSVINGRGADLVWAHDLHPAFVGTRFVARQAGRPVAVQHHHAHAISCALDSEVELPVLAIVGDGMGYGQDGAVWGGEILLCHRDRFDRVAHLDYFGLPGGDAAARQPWRPALSLVSASLPSLCAIDLPFFAEIEETEFRAVERQLHERFNCPSSSSLGRLFDAAAWICGVAEPRSYEGQAARALQGAAEHTEADPLDYELSRGPDALLMNWRPLIRGLVEGRLGDTDPAHLAASFHATVIEMFAAAAKESAGRTGVDRVVMSGGCFFNDILRGGLAERLRGFGMQVATHRVVSTGDAGISVGQAYVAAHSP